MHACVHTGTCVSVGSCMCMCLSVCARMWVCMWVCMWGESVHVGTGMHTEYECVHMCDYACMRVDV